MSPLGIGRRAALSGLIALLAMTLAVPLGTLAGELTVTPSRVAITSFFSGVDMTVTGDLAPGCQAVMIIRGKRIEEELMRKAHHWDLWMNSGEVDIYNAPRLYLAQSSDPALLSPDAPHPWGYADIEKKVSFSGRLKPVEDDTIFQEFVRLKERDQLYRLYPGGLRITRPSPDGWRVQGDFYLPSRIKLGTYHVTLWTLRNGRVLDERTTTFEVSREGLPALLDGMARNHGMLYGLLAVALAMAVGMLTGVIFQRKDGGH